ncbi:MAG: transcriptional repressor [Planctomycetota bacterium]|jgi:Fur family ferric uptake transcriptional regulator|nr:transcriptional repressor [Planctomycetota bacterium]
MADGAHAHDEDMEPAEILSTIQRAVRARGVRWTGQREAIIGTFIDQDRHLTAEELHQLVRAQDATISAATVYRTMNLLVEIGMAAKRHFNGDSASFDLTIGKGHHHHLIDVDSGRIIEFKNDEMEAILATIAEQYGYRIACHKIELFGVPIDEPPAKSAPDE